ncbi:MULTISPECIES: hypothetical protein [unclassified Nocardioides]|uniref:hypothetical protein n=1 Tax=unclassified Nocardioides TaxID=2615069 RepID=UPI0006FABEC8|nr:MULTISPECIES: hypothetical protein [unclassified Nocardioides]KRA37423.1 hypothetical protein ASD81_01445 [Nocardioides sp. Root614]KRA91384.1 hypothetical protein ASD84_01710 [Nocardioides sp. Root682]
MPENQQRPNRPTWQIGVALFLVAATVYVATAGYTRVHIDVLSANVGGWRIASTGEPWIDGVDVDQINRSKVPLFTTTHDGHRVIARSPGVVAAGVPAYALRELATDSGTSADDYSSAPPAVTAALITAVSVVLMWGALLRLTSRRSATAAALVFAFATPVWSVAADGMWTHTLTVLGICGMAYAAARERWLLVGVFGGVATWGRLHTVVIAAAVALACAWLQRRPSIAVRVGVTGALMVAGASIWSHWLYGTWIPSGGYAPGNYVSRAPGSAYDFNTSPVLLLRNEAALWIAGDRGILIWTPLVVLLLPLLIRTWRTQPMWCRAMFLAGVAYTLFQGWAAPFHGGDGIYGYRHGLEFLACATPSLTLAALYAGRKLRLALTVVVGVQLSAFALGGSINRPTLTFGDHWDNNAFVQALRDAPVLIAVLACVVATTVLATRMFLSEPEPEAASARE